MTLENLKRRLDALEQGSDTDRIRVFGQSATAEEIAEYRKQHPKSIIVIVDDEDLLL